MRLLHIFFDTDMRGRQESLIARAKEERKFDMSNFKHGDMMAFINAARNRVMVMAGVDEEDSFGVLAYYRSPHDRVIDPQALQFIPDAFNGQSINMNAAIKKTLV